MRITIELDQSGAITIVAPQSAALAPNTAAPTSTGTVLTVDGGAPSAELLTAVEGSSGAPVAAVQPAFNAGGPPAPLLARYAAGDTPRAMAIKGNGHS